MLCAGWCSKCEGRSCAYPPWKTLFYSSSLDEIIKNAVGARVFTYLRHTELRNNVTAQFLPCLCQNHSFYSYKSGSSTHFFHPFGLREFCTLRDPSLQINPPPPDKGPLHQFHQRWGNLDGYHGDLGSSCSWCMDAVSSKRLQKGDGLHCGSSLQLPNWNVSRFLLIAVYSSKTKWEHSTHLGLKGPLSMPLFALKSFRWNPFGQGEILGPLSV